MVEVNAIFNSRRVVKKLIIIFILLGVVAFGGYEGYVELTKTDDQRRIDFYNDADNFPDVTGDEKDYAFDFRAYHNIGDENGQMQSIVNMCDYHGDGFLQNDGKYVKNITQDLLKKHPISSDCNALIRTLIKSGGYAKNVAKPRDFIRETDSGRTVKIPMEGGKFYGYRVLNNFPSLGGWLRVDILFVCSKENTITELYSSFHGGTTKEAASDPQSLAGHCKFDYINHDITNN